MLKNLKDKLKINIGLKSVVFIAVCIALIAVDILTKIFEEKDGWVFTVIPGLIEVQSGSRNPGCAFSFLAEAAWGQTFLITMTFIMLAVLIAVFIFLPERFTLLKLAIAMIAAGAIGNLIDRIAFHEVRDFVGIRMFGNMVACNFADFWIVIGTAIALIDVLFINEWALIPLTQKAKEAQAKRDDSENKTIETITDANKTVESKTDENTTGDDENGETNG